MEEDEDVYFCFEESGLTYRSFESKVGGHDLIVAIEI